MKISKTALDMRIIQWEHHTLTFVYLSYCGKYSTVFIFILSFTSEVLAVSHSFIMLNRNTYINCFCFRLWNIRKTYSFGKYHWCSWHGNGIIWIVKMVCLDILSNLDSPYNHTDNLLHFVQREVSPLGKDSRWMWC